LGLFDDDSNIILDELLEKAHAGIEAKLRKWAKPPSTTEQDKISRTERMVRDAIKSSDALKNRDITIFIKGSYANRINIPSDSDVDVGVRLNSLYYNSYSEGLSDDDFGLVDATYTLSDFKLDLASAMVSYFDRQNVTVGSKAIKVHSNTCRVDGDVVALATHKRYSSRTSFCEGVALASKSGMIYNWPQQNYDNHVKKNSNTGQRHKPFIKILKNLKKEMANKGMLKTSAPSFLIECLSWNVPDHIFKEEKYKEMTLNCLEYLSLALLMEDTCKEWGEVNELKYLFGRHQSWTRLDAYNFVREVKSYLHSCE
tara:strand:+ start:48105 stop:49043 length:939 start_codon:yes stop_codon:yes gene_type:complete